MLLSDMEILEKISNGELVIGNENDEYPFALTQIQPSSIDLRLGDKFHMFMKDVAEFDISYLLKTDEDLKKVENFDEIYSRINDSEPNKNYITKKCIVKKDTKLIIKPQEVLFGEIYEKLKIPEDCSGMLLVEAKD